MEVKLPKGRYIVAVSGGVDSMVLLHLLVHQSSLAAHQPPVKETKNKKHKTKDLRLGARDSMGPLELIVAHFNHGIRPDSDEDEKLVASLAREHGLRFEAEKGKLGSKTSEDKARQARYAFLEGVRKKYGANSIITAHHQDDYIETVLINILRGTGRQGMVSIAKNENVMRPLLKYPKADIWEYAKSHGIRWHEDTTNSDTDYLRNYIRQNLVSNLSESQKRNLLKNIDKVAEIHDEIEMLIATLSHNVMKNDRIQRNIFALLPSEISTELVAHWLRKRGFGAFDRKTIERLCTALKTAPPGTKHEIYRGKWLIMDRTSAKFSD